MGETDLAAYAENARGGDVVAFEKLVRATARLVYAHVVASVRDRQKAEDLTQETFVAAWKGIATLRQGEGVVSWLLTLARHKVLDARKYDTRQKRGGAGAGDAGAAGSPPAPVAGRRHAEAVELADAAPPPDQDAQRAEAQKRALQVLEELPEEYRRPLAMRYLAGADYDTIRQALALSDGALRGLLSRGMAILRERMSSEYH